MNAPSSLGQSVVNRKQAELLAPEDTRRPIVVVLGMHRSGTSLCSHILSMLGVGMADDVGGNATNPKGHWERWEIVGLQDEVLAALDREYLSPQHDFPLPAAWWAEPKVRAIQARIEGFLTARMPPSGLFGFKDPRTARLLPLWLQIFKNLNLAPRFILCLRAPSQIARSLRQRDGLDPATGEYRALAYVADCFRYLPGHDLCIVEYEKWFENYSDNLHGLMDFLGVEWQQSEADLAAAVSAIVERDLRHSEERLGIARQPLVRSFHNLVAGLRADPARRSEIDRFVNQFVAFQQLLGPFERVQRDYAAIAARAPALDARIAELEGALQASATAGHEREQELRDLQAIVAGERDAARAELADAARVLAANDEKSAALGAALLAAEAAADERERSRREAVDEHHAERANLAGAREALAENEARLIALDASWRASSQADQKRETALRDELAQLGQELALAENEARLIALDASWRASSQADQKRETALRDELAQRGQELALAANEASRAQQHANAAEEANGQLNDELAAAQAALREAREREEALRDELAPLADALEAARSDHLRSQGDAQRANEANAQLNDDLAAVRHALHQAHERELALRASAEMATNSFAERSRALREQLVDTDAALARSKFRESRGILSVGSRKWERKLTRSGLFDAEWYLEQYRDAAEGPRSPIRHYFELGYLRGYMPNPFFDTRWYLGNYDDVRRSGTNPLVHYMLYGAREGRDPGPRFHTDYYLEANPDVRMNGVNPLAHYLRHGRHEGRTPSRGA